MNPRREHLPADVLGLKGFAARGVAGRLDLRGTHLVRASTDVEPPADALLPEERAWLAERMEHGLAPFEPHVAVVDSVRALAEAGTSVVVTGVDVALAPPPDALYRALSCVQLARSLAQRLERPVLPLVWLRGEQHTPETLPGTHVLTRHHEARPLALDLPPGAHALRVPLTAADHGLGALRAMVRQELEHCEHVDAALDLCLPREGEDLVQAAARALLELCGPLGLLVCDPAWLREDHGRSLARLAALDPGLLDGDGEEEGEEDARDAPARDAHAPTPWFTHLTDDGPAALTAGGDGFRFAGEPGSRNPAELAAEVVQAPHAYAACAPFDALLWQLRLPLAAVVVDWDELAQLERLAPLRRALGLGPPACLPAVGATLTDVELRAARERSGAAWADVLRARGTLAAGFVADEPPVLRALREHAAGVGDGLKALRADLAELDPALAVLARRAASDARAPVEALLRKAERLVANRVAKAEKHLRRLDALHARGRPQAAGEALVYWVARCGPDLGDALFHSWDAFAAEHLLFHLLEGPAREDAGEA